MKGCGGKQAQVPVEATMVLMLMQAQAMGEAWSAE